MLTRAAASAIIALALLPATASASARDVAATHAYIQANYALERASAALIPATATRIQAYNAKLASECPHAGNGSPEDEASQPMSYEVAVALWAVSYGTSAGPIRKFAAAVKPLRWSSARITRVAHRYATELSELATLPVPDLCADVRAWTASGFQTIPADVAALDRRLEAIEPENVPASLLAPFVQGSDASTVVRARKLEVRLAENEFMVGQDDWLEVLETLGLRE